MESLLKMEGRNIPAHLVQDAKRRRIWDVTLRAFTSILLTAGAIPAATAATINLSPMVAKSTALSAVDTGKEINVILSLPLGDSAGAAQFVQRASNPKDALAPTAAATDVCGGTGPGGAYAPSDLRTAYRIPHFGAVAPQTVAVFEQGGYFKYDVETYLARMKLPHPTLSFVGVNGFSGYVYDFGVELEAVLDIDMIIAINPQVKEVVAYEDGKDPFGVALIDALDQVAQDNKVQMLSISYGLDEIQQGNDQLTAENTALTQLSALGITVVVSAGDNGAYGRTGTNNFPATLEAPDPGSQPLVTCVGGTRLTTGPKEVYFTVQAWNRLGSS